MNYEQLAKKRVVDNPELTAHEETIFYDWSNWDQHMEWVATAPVEKIVSWATGIESYSTSRAASMLGSLGGSANTAAQNAARAANAKFAGRKKGSKNKPK